MDYALAHHILFFFFFFFFLLFLPFLTVAQTNGRVDVGTSMTANDKDTPWLSPSGDFAFGFKQLPDKNLFLLSIWYHKIPDETIVWYGDDGVPVSTGSKLDLIVDRGLVLTDPQGKELWNSPSIRNDVSYGFMNDTGNFVLVRSSDSSNMWESFKYPTDTMLPTQIMESGGVIFSRLTETNFSQGRFQFRLLPDGNLVLNSRDITSNLAYAAYYVSGTYDPSNSSNSGYEVIFDDAGVMYILRRNNQRLNLTPQQMSRPSTEYYHRATLNFDGVFTQYYHPKSFDNGTKWTPLWSQPDNICLYMTEIGSGACGFNSICSLSGYKRPQCKCPPGYSLLDPNNSYGSCKPDFAQSCGEDDINLAEELYDFEPLTDTDWPTSDYEQLQPVSEAQCKKACINDCFCAVAILRGDSCWKKKLPLSNGREDRVVNGQAFMKFRKSDIPTVRSPPRTLPAPPSVPETKKNQGALILVGSILLGSSLFVNFVLIGAVCLGFFLIYQKKSIKIGHGGHSAAAENNLRCFTYEELTEATDGFKEELGSGAFGIVYKGAIQMGSGSRVVVAVKKLDRLVEQKEKEFKTEVNVIGRTHHRNLVRLLGFCDQGQHRLLVYEFMSNGTLASFLFGDNNKKPGWNLRTEIALGIARGLVYLHEECSTQIIHCDIKPQNILLDDYYNARISDFGLAKLLMMNQSKTNPATIRGTKGYVAPEWFNKNPITAKVDIYSFGVLLLEIISCRKSLGDLEIGEEEKIILADWACDCFQEGKLDDLVENDVEALNDWKRVERFFMVAFWCIQEDPSLRPTMRTVTQMLEGVVEVTVPPRPSQFSFTS